MAVTMGFLTDGVLTLPTTIIARDRIVPPLPWRENIECHMKNPLRAFRILFRLFHLPSMSMMHCNGLFRIYRTAVVCSHHDKE
jgi:hypothetical protein